ncbi:hypothetical protein C482_14854 [Natrialba chahannaoensis JCM 10990]|uniref:Uncharacterized protein n=2 Tax=Natrialba chahannaoensis TaxID=68911 RepID=M0AGC6_9EURY|nr:hypothetical protein C482_14854 [Natrialba chahannaoensis JCM 10990]
MNEIRVELIGALQKRQSDGTWEQPVDITAHRVFVEFGNVSIPALSLQYEATAYEQMGRSDRAALLEKYADD